MSNTEAHTAPVTEQDIKALTPQHRIVWHSPPGQPVEMGLYVDKYGILRTDTGSEAITMFALDRIVRIIPPPFTRGMIIGHPTYEARRLVCWGDGAWLGRAPDIGDGHWFDDGHVHALIEHHGWVVMPALAGGADDE